MKNSGLIVNSDFLLNPFLIFLNFSLNSMFFLWNFLEKKFYREILMSESWLTKGMGQNNIFILKASKSIMRLEPWPSSLSCQRHNQKSIFRLLIRSIIKVNKIIFVLAAPHIFCVIFKTKKSEICCESVIHTFLHRLFCLKTGFFCHSSISLQVINV
jgi:hypothetical protein